MELDGHVKTAAVTGNVFVRQEHAVGCCTEGPAQAALRNVFCAGALQLHAKHSTARKAFNYTKSILLGRLTSFRRLPVAAHIAPLGRNLVHV